MNFLRYPTSLSSESNSITEIKTFRSRKKKNFLKRGIDISRHSSENGMRKNKTSRNILKNKQIIKNL